MSHLANEESNLLLTLNSQNTLLVVFYIKRRILQSAQHVMIIMSMKVFDHEGKTNVIEIFAPV